MQETQETRVQSLAWEDHLEEEMANYSRILCWKIILSFNINLEKEMAAHSSILAWKIPWTEESGGLQSMGSQRVRT